MDNITKVKIVSAGLIALGIYYFYKQKNQDAEVANDQINTSENSNQTSTKPDWNKLLKKGSVGEEVKRLQTALKTLVVDGNFGDLTEARLKKVMNVTETSINQYNKFISKK
jgi:hypothetical protein